MIKNEEIKSRKDKKNEDENIKEQRRDQKMNNEEFMDIERQIQEMIKNSKIDLNQKYETKEVDEQMIIEQNKQIYSILD